MSHWGATVITNLLSAIPWIGVDFVEFDNYNLYLKILPTIGTVKIKGLRGLKARTETEKSYALEIPYKFLSMLIGLIDGDGYISITKQADYIRIQLIISMDIRETEMLKYIHSILKVGRINEYSANSTVKYTISRTDLQEIIFPLFIHHKLFFLTNTRRNQFALAFFILQNNLFYFADIPTNYPQSYNLPKTAIDYTLLPFFKNWIVGFNISEGSFFEKNNNDFCFSLRQRTHTLLFNSFKIIFDTNKNIEERDGYSTFIVS